MKENSGFSLVRNIVAIAVVLLMILWAAAQQSSVERVRQVSGPEDLKCELIQAQLVAPPSASYLCYDGGKFAYVPGSSALDREFAEGLVARLLPGGLTSWPVTVYEDAITRETVFLNANGTEIYRMAAEAGYDPLWAARYLFPGRELSASAAFRYDPSRVLFTARLVEPDAFAAAALTPRAAKRSVAKYVALESPGAGYKDYLLLWTSPTNLWLGAVTGTVASVKGFDVGYSHGLAVHSDGSVTRIGLDPQSAEIAEQRFSVADASVAAAGGFGDSFVALSGGSVWRAIAGGGFVDYTGISNAVALAAGPTFAIALLTDGTVASWGTNSTGSIAAPAGLSNVVEIAAGSTFGVARCQDGTVTAWGDGSITTGGLAGVSALSASAQGGHCLALRTNGTVAAWGDNSSGQCDVPASLTGVTAIAAGGTHSMALKADGTIVCWGSLSQAPAGLTNAVSIGASYLEACALTADGKVVVWDANTTAEGRILAMKSPGSCSLQSAQLSGFGLCMIAVRAADGSLESDADGDGLLGWQEIFVYGTDPVSADSDADGMEDGWELAFGLNPIDGNDAAEDPDDDGLANLGEAQTGTNPSKDDTDDDGLEDGAEVFARVVEWGTSYSGTNGVARPAAPGDVVSLAVGATHILALRSDGTMCAWGNNSSGQCTLSPALSNLTAVAVAASANNSAAIASDGSVVCWGSTNNNLCLPPAAATNVTHLALASNHGIALLSTSNVVCWGQNTYGQCEPPANLSSVVDVAAGLVHSAALCADGRVVCWGYSSTYNYGQTNVPASATNVIAIAAGNFHSVALRADGTVVCWGQTSSGKCDVPADLTNAVAIAAGVNHSLAYTADGRIVAWGLNTAGQARSLRPYGHVLRLDGGTTLNAALIASTTSPLSADTDSDGMPDGWEMAYGPDLLSPTDDLDGDGLSNAEEFAEGGNPLSLDSDGDGLADGEEVHEFGTAPGLVDTDGDGFDDTEELYGRVIEWGQQYTYTVARPAHLVAIKQVAAGRYHLCAVRTNGTVVCWGSNTGNCSTPPASATNIETVAAGAYYNIAIRKDGSVLCWGETTYGKCSVPSDLTNAVAVSAGFGHSLAVRADGTVCAWGWNVSGQCNVPPGLTNVMAVAAGSDHSVALCRDGHVVCWGSTNYSRCAVPAGLTNAVAIAAGYNHTAALKADGSVVCWGASEYCSVPPSLTNVVRIGAGSFHTITYSSDGRIVSWGNNNFGQCAQKISYAPALSIGGGFYTSMAFLQGVTDPNNADSDNDAISDRDEVVTQGTNPLNPDTDGDGLDDGYEIAHALNPLDEDSDDDGLSDGFEVDHGLNPLVSVLDPDGDGVVNAIELQEGTNPLDSDTDDDGIPDGWEIRYGLDPLSAADAAFDPDNDGLTNLQEYALGLNPLDGDFDKDGVGDGEEVSLGLSPTDPDMDNDGLTDGEELITIGTDPFAVDTDADGLNDAEETFSRLVQWGTVTNISYWVNPPACFGKVIDLSVRRVPIITQPSHHVVLRADGSVLCWGYNYSGQCNVPAAATNVVAVGAGSSHSLALRADGSVVCWGTNSSGQCAVPAGATNIVSIAAGGNHNVAVQQNGGVICWGANNYGQCSIPAGLTSNNTAVGVAAGYMHSAAIDGHGSVYCWGYNNSGQCAVPAEATNVVGLAAGTYHNVALRADGTVVCWGMNTSGQCTVPAGLTNVIAVGAGSVHSLAYLADGRIVCWGRGAEGQAETQNPYAPVLKLDGGAKYSLALVEGTTSPLNADSDGDGLSDGNEVLIRKTDPTRADTDGDALSDGAESALGTNPLKVDTDSDGLDDGFEVAHQLNPLVSVPDPDSDGLTNVQERELGTNPLVADTDGDGMPDGWEVAHGLDPATGVTAGLAGWWQFREGGGAVSADLSGNSNDAIFVLTNGVSWTSSAPVGAALRFKTVTDTNAVGYSGGYVCVPGLSNAPVANGFSVAAWVRADSYPPYASILTKASDHDAWQDGFSLYHEDGDSLALYVGDWNLGHVGSGVSATGVWLHVCGVYTSSNASLYVNGQLCGTLANATGSLANNDALWIGSTFFQSRWNWDGDIADVRFYTSALTTNDIQGFFEAQADSDGDGLSNVNEYVANTDPENADTDADGLGDGYEVAHGLNPLSQDTDSDGLPDAWETSRTGFDPCVWQTDGVHGPGDDADGDGLSNLYEYYAGTNPNIWDTDGDYMPDGWEYWHMGTNPTYADGDVDIDNDGLTNYSEYVNQTDPCSSDSDMDGLTDGDEVLNYGTNPTLWDTDQDGLSDAEEVWYYSSNPLLPDTDYDGMPDGWEVSHGFNPATYDSMDDADGDGVNNGNEYAIGTDPQSGDTDGDGLSDGMELSCGTNPLSGDSDGDGMSDGWEYNNGLSPVDPSDGGYDRDGDGLSNYDECVRQTNPNAWDTDGDMLSDYEEINNYGSNPNAWDTDGDTIGDYDEVYYYGTSPSAWDTDGDSLGDAEELFSYGTGPLSWDSDGDGLDDGLEVYFVGTSPTNSDTDGDGMPDGWEFGYMGIGLNPTYADADGDIDSDGLTNYGEYTNQTNPGSSDSDMDMLSDGDEVNVYHTYPNAWDTDGDMLGDGHEVWIYFSDPLLPDTDGDGLTDGWEINNSHTSPTNGDTDADGLSDSWELDHGFNPLSGMVGGLIGWWRGGITGTNVTDLSGSGNDAVILAPQHVSEITNYPAPPLAGLHYDGAYDPNWSQMGFVNVPGVTNTMFGTPFTMAAWVRLQAPNIYNLTSTIFLWWNEDYDFWTGKGSFLTAYFFGDITDYLFAVIDPAMVGIEGLHEDHGQWTHVCGVFDGTNGYLYVNGQLTGVQAYTPCNTNMGPLWIGTTLGPGGDNGYVKGDIADARFYSSALSSNEISTLIEFWADSDGDGLSNIDEQRAGTDPRAADSDGDLVNDRLDAFPLDPAAWLDTDGDGMPDELYGTSSTGLVEDTDDDNDGMPDLWETAPAHACLNAKVVDASIDSDGDGLSNIEEYELQTNPCNPDTDGDGVSDGPADPDGEGVGIVAGPDAFPLDPAAWLDTDGDGQPNELHGQSTTGLVEDKDDDNDGVADGAQDPDGDGPIIAGPDAFPLDPSAWLDTDSDGLPDEIHGVSTTGLTEDADDDNDGMSDVWEASYACMNPKVPDGAEDDDGDGLTNYTEYLRGTAPDKQDTDGDGISDNYRDCLLMWDTNPFEEHRDLGFIDHSGNCVSIDEGFSFNMALFDDGSVHIYEVPHGGLPTNYCGISDVPGSVTNAIAIAAGELHCLALLADGKVKAWGYNANGQCDVPAFVTNAVAISAGEEHSLALLADGKVVAWGTNTIYRQCDIPEAVSNQGAIAIVARGLHSMALLPDRSVVAWGCGADGRTNVPSVVNEIGASAIASSYATCFARLENGAYSVWGNDWNLESQFPGTLANKDVVSIGAGRGNALWAITREGGLYVSEYGARPPIPHLEHPRFMRFLKAGSDSYKLTNAVLVRISAAALESADPDNDGLSSRDELFVYNTNPCSKDTDGDTLEDGVEVAYGLNPLDPADALEDADGDGLSNAYELNTLKTDPLLSDSDGDGLDDGTETLAHALFVDGTSQDYSLTWASPSSMLGTSPAVAVGATKWDRTVLFQNGTALQRRYSGGATATLEGVAGIACGTYQTLFVDPSGGALGLVQTVPTDPYFYYEGAFGAFPRQIAAGFCHAIALRPDGTVTNIGAFADASGTIYTDDPPTPLPTLTSIVPGANMGDFASFTAPAITDNPPMSSKQVAAGVYNAIALGEDGKVKMWGRPYQNILSVPADLSNVVKAVGGVFHTVALLSNGTVRAWGRNTYGQLNIPSGLSNVVDIACTDYSTVALRSNGTLAAWGFSYDSVVSAVPTNVTRCVSVFAVGDAAWGITADGQVFGWGDESMSFSVLPRKVLSAAFTNPGSSQEHRGVALVQLGTNPLSKDSDNDGLSDKWEYLQAFNPRDPADAADNDANGMPDLWEIKHFGSAGQNPYADPDGDGLNNGEECDRGTNPFSDDSDGDGLFDGWEDTYGFDPLVWQTDGQHGPGDDPDGDGLTNSDESYYNANPWAEHTDTDGISDYDEVYLYATRPDLSDSDSDGLTDDKELFAVCFFGGTGCLSVSESAIPQPSLYGITSASAGDRHVVALKSDKTVVCWGDNTYQQCEPPANLTNVIDVAAGINYSLALTADGQVVSWGYFGTYVLAVVTNAVDIQACEWYVSILTADKRVISTGFGTAVYGLPPPEDLTNVKAVSVGCSHYAALTEDGHVICWDNNGQMWDVPADLTNAVEVAAGYWHTVALTADGQVRCWGNNQYEQCTVPEGLSGITHIGAGAYHSLAATTNGDVVAWGLHNMHSSQVNEGMTLPDVETISIGAHVLSLKGGNGYSVAHLIGTTDPMNPDTDGDGILDGDDIIPGQRTSRVHIVKPTNGQVLTNSTVRVTGVVHYNGSLGELTVGDEYASFQKEEIGVYSFTHDLRLDNGPHTVSVNALSEDSSSIAATNVTFTVRLAQPQITILTPAPNQIVTNITTVSGEIRFLGDVDWVKVAGEFAVVTPSAPNTYTFSRDVTLNAGTKSIAVEAHSIGNPSVAGTNQVTVFAYAIAPVITIATPKNNQLILDDTVSVSGTVRYTGGLAGITIFGYPATLERIDAETYAYSESYSLGDGVYTMPVVAITQAAPPRYVTNSVTFRVNSLAPVLEILSPTNNTVFRQTPAAIQVTVQTEAATDIVTVNGQSTTANGCMRTATLYFPTSALYQVQAQSVDTDGLTATTAIEIYVDEQMNTGSISNSMDAIFVLDTSSSMQEDNDTLDQTREAGFMIANSSTNDRIGLVSFVEQAKMEMPLVYAGETMKAAAFNKLHKIEYGGGTLIQTGLNEAQEMFNINGRTNAQHMVVLSTDEDTFHCGDVEKLAPQMRITTLDMKNNWYHDSQSWLAQRRKGIYLVTPTAAGWMTVAGVNGLMSATEATQNIETTNQHEVCVSDDLQDVVFRVNPFATNTVVAVSLTTPTGTVVTPANVGAFANISYVSWPGGMCYKVKRQSPSDPLGASWHLNVSSAVTGEMYSACAYSESGVRAKLFLDRIQYAANEEIPIRLAVPPNTTTAWVEITNVWAGVGYRMEMLDNGQASNGDLSANDGVFSCLFANTSTNNRCWRITAHAEGSSIHRVTERAIYIGLSDWTQLNTPTIVGASDGTYSDQVTITWNNSVSGASHYEVLRAPEANSEQAVLIGVTNKVEGAATLTWTDRDPAVIGHQHYYWVRAYTDRLNNNYSRRTDSELSAPDAGHAGGL